MSNPTAPCPPQKTLVNFLLGKLKAQELESCELHLNECEPCGDTIRNLDVNDTLIGLAANCQPAVGVENSDSDRLIVKMLIDKLEDLQPSEGTRTSRDFSNPEMRADEIINLLQPGDQAKSLGRIAHYDIREVLGIGATSVVFRAMDQQLHRDVAVKILRPSLGEDARERFLAEARAAAALDHENIITIYQVATEGHLAYMAQQWLPGETLESKLEREEELGEKFDAGQIKRIAIQIAKGLAAAHAKNLIHRDIKPANIWIESERERAIILDFGLVRVTDDNPKMTETGIIAGTPCFMSPEQTRGKEIDARSDLFSLGCLMYRLCCGRLPFHAPNTLATLQAIQEEEPLTPSQVDPTIPAEWSSLVMALLNKNVDERPQSAELVFEALTDPSVMQNLLVSLPVPKTKPIAKRKNPARHRWLWGAAAALVLVAIAALLFAGPQIVRIVTNHGVLEIESDDPSVAIEVLKGGEVVYVIDEKTKQKLEIKSGSYKIRPQGDENSFDLSQDSVTMKRGGKVIVTVKKLPNAGTSSEKATADATGNTEPSSSIPELEAIHNATIELFEDAKAKYEAGMVPPNDFYSAQAEMFKAEAELRLGTGENDRAVECLVKAVGAFQSKYDVAIAQYEQGGGSMQAASEAKLELTRAQLKLDRFSKRIVDSTNSNAGELTYENKTFSQWLAILKTERSPARLQTALTALKSIGSNKNGPKVASEILKLMRIFGDDYSSYELQNLSWKVLLSVDKQVLVDSILEELKQPNENSGKFLLGFRGYYHDQPETDNIGRQKVKGQRPTVDPEYQAGMDRHAAVFVQRLSRLIQSNDPEDKKHQVWSSILLATWALDFKWRDDQSQTTEMFTEKLDKLTDRDAIYNVAMYLAKFAPQTNGLDEKAVDLIDKKMLFGFHILEEIGNERISDESIERLVELVKNSDFELASAVYPTQGFERQSFFGHAIPLFGSLGERAESALPFLEEVSTKREYSSYWDLAMNAIMRIKFPKVDPSELTNMQGEWKLEEYWMGLDLVDLANKKNTPDVMDIDRFRLRPLNRGRTVDERFPSLTIRHFGGDGSIDLLANSNESEIELKGIYKLEDDKLMFCFSNGDRPTSFEAAAGTTMIILTR